ncbi:MAG: hypothetical protein PHR47_01100 [Candidatus Pacebacteria bacterium]|nr:hypothetical protein [Candidatus Paceibacterota bacterium]
MNNNLNKLNYLHICENAFLSEGTRNLNIIGIFDTINTKGFPAAQPRFAVVANITASNEDGHKTTLSIEKNGKKIVELNSNFKGKKQQLIQNFLNFPFPEEGNYDVVIRLDEDLIGSTIIILKKI